MFAGQAAVLLANVQLLASSRRFSAGLTEAVRSRDQISVAKGIVMAREEVDETAFSILVGEAQRDHKQVREGADLLVRSTVRLRR
jgi:AmiR/NasT family two-component response regulator